MRFGFWASTKNDWEHILAVSRAAEASGWDGLWLPDHFMAPEGGYGDEPFGVHPELLPNQECWTLLAALAMAVPRVRIGAMVTGNTYRHPAVLAKQAASVDHISGGRLVLGLGAGWQENEHRRYGIEFGTARDRADMLEEACAVITSLFANERTDFDGVHYRLQGAPLVPKPLQDPLPIMIGGKGERPHRPHDGALGSRMERVVHSRGHGPLQRAHRPALRGRRPGSGNHRTLRRDAAVPLRVRGGGGPGEAPNRRRCPGWWARPPSLSSGWPAMSRPAPTS